MNKKLNVAIIGMGRISGKHVDALRALEDRATIKAVCDIDPVALSCGAEATGARPYASLAELLREEKDLDLVSVCTPSGIHPEQGIEIARHGINVLVEKPMGVRLADGRRLVEVCDREGVKLFVVKQNRFNPTLMALKSAIDKGRLGKLYMIVANVFWTRPQDYYDQAKWRGTWALDGGAFMNQASHYVDLVQWLGGPIAGVQAATATLARKIEAEDTGAAIVEFKSGTIATINVTMLTHGKNFEGSITILGEKGTARIGGVALNEVKHWSFDVPSPSDADVVQASYSTDSVYGNGHGVYYKNVLDYLAGENAAVVDGVEGLKSLLLLEAIYLSSRQGKRIETAIL